MNSSQLAEAELWNFFEPKPEPQVKRVAATRLEKRKVEVSDDTPAVKRPRRESPAISFTTKFSKSPNASEPVIIAGFRDQSDQDHFNRLGLSSGVRWEIARLVSRGRLNQASIDTLNNLKGSSKEAAPKTAEIVLQLPELSHDSLALEAERKSQCPWDDLDKEEAALALNPNAALGNCPELEGYGGKACFVGTMDLSTRKIELDRFLRIRVSKNKTDQKPECSDEEFFLKPFIIFQSVFRSFSVNDGTVILFKTRESFKNGVIQMDPSSSGLTLFEFLQEFNPLQLNTDQVLCKWASRFALGLSNSVPGPILEPHNVEEIADIISPANSNMTDGCGLSNMAFNLKLQRDFKLDTMPCAVQVRHGGRKGMLLVYPDWSSYESVSVPQVAFRNPSQVKIVYSEEAKAHPANATMDLLRFSHTRTPARISPEVIINLEHNGVPAMVFINMQNSYLAQGVEDMLFWVKDPLRNTPEDMVQLYAAVERSESVYFARKIRQAGGEARIRGQERYNNIPEEQDDDDADDQDGALFDKDVRARSTAWWPDYISGCPSGLAETVMNMLDVGFIPQLLPVLRDKLKQIVLKTIRSRAENFKYDVIQSAGAFVVPDFWEVLGVDEIHFKSSRREFQGPNGAVTDIIVGDVLMTRNPCKLPSDVRKLKAVRHPQLHDLVDVIVCSVKGQRRLLDFLAGGDYDGDKAIVIWDKEIVEAFTNASDSFSNEPEGLGVCFERDETTVATFLAVHGDKAPEVQAGELQKYLLRPLRDPSAVGQYSNYHDVAILTKGYDNPRTIKLAYQFCKILDSSKTGYILKNATRMADQNTYGGTSGPAWKQDKPGKEKKLANRDNRVPAVREIKPGSNNSFITRKFIMDILAQAAKSQKDQWLQDVEQLFQPFESSGKVFDADLAEPWKTYMKFAQSRELEGNPLPRNDLSIIEKHVEDMFARHKREMRGSKGRASGVTSFTDRPIEDRQDTFRALSRDFAAAPTPDQLQTIPDATLIARLRASYAYIYDNKKESSGWSRFPWNVAFGELCQIKARARGPHKTVTMGFYERYKLSGSRRT